jgi:hypothetical protein
LIIRLYLEEDSMRHSLVNALRSRGMDVTTALEEKMLTRLDEEQLDYATQQGRVLFTFNRGDFVRLHTQYLSQGKSHAGIIVANQQQYTVGEQMRRILHLAAALSVEDMRNRLEFLNRWGTGR